MCYLLIMYSFYFVFYVDIYVCSMRGGGDLDKTNDQTVIRSDGISLSFLT